MNHLLLISDNEYLLSRFRELMDQLDPDLRSSWKLDCAYSYFNRDLQNKFSGSHWIRPVHVKNEVQSIVRDYQLVISLHCKQLFPAEMTRGVRCINVHPGLNPHNRGWFPQVFSLINGKPCGATIHEIDEELDHGPVICQQEVAVDSWDTSLSVYNKVLSAEIDLLRKHLPGILLNTYTTSLPAVEGNLNLKSDFDKLCQLDLNDTDTLRNHINRLRALSHGNFENAFFIDEAGNKVMVKIELRKA